MPATSGSSQEQSARQTWSDIVQTEALVDYFKGVFHRVGIVVKETGEEFTVIHDGTTITFEPGIAGKVDFLVPVSRENVANLVAHAADGVLDEEESWRIVQVLFTPFTQATLEQPIFRRAWLRMASGVEGLIHVYLVGPAGSVPVTHTLAFAGGQWLVLPGLHGKPKRTFRMTPADALNFQRHVFAAMQEDSFSGWWQFANWYREWRIRVGS